MLSFGDGRPVPEGRTPTLARCLASTFIPKAASANLSVALFKSLARKRERMVHVVVVESSWRPRSGYELVVMMDDG